MSDKHQLGGNLIALNIKRCEIAQEKGEGTKFLAAE